MIEDDTHAADGASSERPIGVGDRVGRYVLEEVLGQGGMGAVYRARDPELGRDLAIKLIRPDRAASDVLQQRLLRESQAMAKLAHPNVVTIYDIGRARGHIFIAMELATSGTLRDWLWQEQRDWREIVARFALAGRGLRAAHDAGFVHRDFKPENVLITADGSVRVADFGIVGIIDTPDLPSGEATEGHLTQHGARIGTPRYMAPEQHDGGHAGTAADQFAFGIAIYEALYDEHPFGGETWAELATAVKAGVVQESAGDVPAALRRVVVRALRVDPLERWPSMNALLDALDRLSRAAAEPADPAQRPKVAALRRALDDATAIGDAGRYDDALPRLHAVAADALALGYAPLSADALAALGMLQANMGDLRGAEATLGKAIVEAARARDDGLSARLWSDMLFLIGYRARRTADAMLLRPAVEAAFARCPDDVEVQAQYYMTLGVMLMTQAHYHDGLAAFERAAASFLIAFGPASPQLGRAINNIGIAFSRLGRYDEARRHYERAGAIIETAVGPTHPLAAVPLNNHGELLAELGDHAGALALHERAYTIRERALHADHPYLALSQHNLGAALLALGRPGEARHELERALAVRRKVGETTPEVADSLAALGRALVATGAIEDGLDDLARALAIAEAAAGAEHPSVATIEHYFGAALAQAGRPRDALAHHQRSLAIVEAALGGDHPHAARARAAIAQIEPSPLTSTSI